LPVKPERLAAGALLILLALATPVAALAGTGTRDFTTPGIRQAAPPDEDCVDESPRSNTGQKLCEDVAGGSGGLPSWVGTALVAVVGTGVLALAVAYLVLRRQASIPVAPADPTEWWTCPNCRSTNVIDSARCYSCGTLRR
jgi:hypothetical protein